MRLMDEPVELQPAPPNWRHDPAWLMDAKPMSLRSSLELEMLGEHPRGIMLAAIAVEDDRAAMVAGIGRYRTHGLHPRPGVPENTWRQHPGDSSLVITTAIRTSPGKAVNEAWKMARLWQQGSLGGESCYTRLWLYDPVALDAATAREAARQSTLILEANLKVQDAGDCWSQPIAFRVEPVSQSVLEVIARRRRILSDCSLRSLLPDDLATTCVGIMAGALRQAALSQWPDDLVS